MIRIPSLYTFPPTPSPALPVGALFPITTLKPLAKVTVTSTVPGGFPGRECHSLLRETLPSRFSRTLRFPGSPPAPWSLLCQCLLVPQTLESLLVPLHLPTSIDWVQYLDFCFLYLLTYLMILSSHMAFNIIHWLMISTLCSAAQNSPLTSRLVFPLAYPSSHLGDK